MKTQQRAEELMEFPLDNTMSGMRVNGELYWWALTRPWET